MTMPWWWVPTALPRKPRRKGVKCSEGNGDGGCTERDDDDGLASGPQLTCYLEERWAGVDGRKGALYMTRGGLRMAGSPKAQ